MAEGESTTQEKVTNTRSGLLYHGTTGGIKLKEELMLEYGLFAHIPTLTPSLEIALDHASGGRENLLTFWYPKKQEVVRGGYESTIPTVPISDFDKNAIITRIQNSHMPNIIKGMLIDSAGSAKTLLPSSSLGAVALLSFDQSIALRTQFPTHDSNYLQAYSAKQSELVKDVKNILDETKIHFFNPNLDTQRLAGDIVKTDLEHFLLSLGRNINSLKQQNASISERDRRTWQKMLLVLQDTHLPEPFYERYIQMLVTKGTNAMWRQRESNPRLLG